MGNSLTLTITTTSVLNEQRISIVHCTHSTGLSNIDILPSHFITIKTGYII